jgi:hypothetical protein
MAAELSHEKRKFMDVFFFPSIYQGRNQVRTCLGLHLSQLTSTLQCDWPFDWLTATLIINWLFGFGWDIAGCWLVVVTWWWVLAWLWDKLFFKIFFIFLKLFLIYQNIKKYSNIFLKHFQNKKHTIHRKQDMKTEWGWKRIERFIWTCTRVVRIPTQWLHSLTSAVTRLSGGRLSVIERTRTLAPEVSSTLLIWSFLYL